MAIQQYSYFVPNPQGGRDTQVVVSAEEYRIIRLLLDPWVHKGNMGPNRVICIPCGSRVNFNTEERFSLSEWEAHKSGCHQCNALRNGAQVPFVHEAQVAFTDADHAVTRREVATKTGMFSARMPMIRQIVDREARRSRN